MRHGEALGQAATDADRALTEFGARQVRDVAGHLLGKSLTSIQTSPYLRAQQSAEIVATLVDYRGPYQSQDWLRPQTDPVKVTDEIDWLAVGNHLLIGHQPLLGRLLGLLVDGELRHPYPLATAGLAELEGELPVPGGMRLVAVY